MSIIDSEQINNAFNIQYVTGATKNIPILSRREQKLSVLDNQRHKNLERILSLSVGEISYSIQNNNNNNKLKYPQYILA